MKVVLGFHYRSDPQREVIYDKIRPIVDEIFPFDDTFECDSGHDPYNRAASRNLVVQKALDVAADVVVICDADSIPERQPLLEAINGAYNDGKLHVPFDKVNLLSPALLRRHSIRFERARPIYSYGPSCGGIYVIRPGRWADAGGMDERVVGWGYEDEIFLVATSTFLGQHISHAGTLYTFNHSRGFNTDFQYGNTILRDSYNENIGNQDKIREIQRGSNKWCST